MCDLKCMRFLGSSCGLLAFSSNGLGVVEVVFCWVPLSLLWEGSADV